jgi:2,3-bisphosphoglycerate-independent phosphoglycerate mutase
VKVIEGIRNGIDLIVTNFANGDVIGHTSNNSAKVQCAGLVDAHLGQVIEAALASDYVTLVTADHGNLELMINPDGTAHVSHTSNPVPFIFIDPHSTEKFTISPGKLADIAPTILHALDLPKSPLMNGHDLVPGHSYSGRQRVLLIILDGWGIGKADDTNPIHLAETPVFDRLLAEHSSTLLEAAGEAVGLKPGKAGNSEAGHINIGAGRVILQDDVRLDLAMQDGSFFTNEILCQTIQTVKSRGTRLHLIGLLTEKSSHGSIDYPLAVLRMAKAQDLRDVFLHLIFDGRSTEPGSAPALLEKLDGLIKEIGIGQIVTGVGRGIALDRDGNYDKTRRTYEALVDGTGIRQPIDG